MILPNDILLRDSSDGQTVWVSQRLVCKICGVDEDHLRKVCRDRYKASLPPSWKRVTEQEEFFYTKDDPEARIIKKVVVSEGDKNVTVKVAKTDAEGRIVPLSSAERQDFVNYMKATSFAGIPTNVVSTNPDTIRYQLEIYHNSGYPVDTVKTRVKKALDEFKTSLDFDSKFYPQHLIACLVNLEEVVTVNPVKIEHRYGAGAYHTVGVDVELISGYFEYADDSELTLISI